MCQLSGEDAVVHTALWFWLVLLCLLSLIIFLGHCIIAVWYELCSLRICSPNSDWRERDFQMKRKTFYLNIYFIWSLKILLILVGKTLIQDLLVVKGI